MFSIQPVEQQGLSLLELRDNIHGTRVLINSRTGALLHAFDLPVLGKRINIIMGYSDANDLAGNLTGKGFRGCKLAPFAGRLYNSQYTWKGKTSRCGRFMLGQHALHGFLYDAPFAETDRDVKEHGATVTLSYAYRGQYEGFPFHFDCDIIYRLLEGNTLDIITHYSNCGTEAFPLLDGWHPYFDLGAPADQLELHMQTLEHVETDDDLIPTGALKPYDRFVQGRLIGDMHFDDCYRLDMQAPQPLITLTNPANGLRLEMQPGEGYPYVQVYTPSDRQTIAIENMSGAPDCFNNGMGLKILEPGEQFTCSTRLTLHVSQV